MTAPVSASYPRFEYKVAPIAFGVIIDGFDVAVSKPCLSSTIGLDDLGNFVVRTNERNLNSRLQSDRQNTISKARKWVVLGQHDGLSLMRYVSLHEPFIDRVCNKAFGFIIIHFLPSKLQTCMERLDRYARS